MPQHLDCRISDVKSPQPARQRKPLLGRYRLFIKDRSGANAVEFGIVALPFFALMMAIIEASMAFFAGQLLDTGLNDAARLIRTGQAQASAYDAARFKQEVCNRIPALITCNASLTIDVRVATSFSTSNFTVPTASGNFDSTQTQYNIGGSSSVVVARAFYKWPSFANLLGSSLSNQADKTILLVATSAFRNEPF